MDRATVREIGKNAKWQEAQGLVNFGYRYLPFGRYVLIQVTDSAKVKQWLRDISTRVTTATTNPTEQAINVAFTSRGLQSLGISDDALASFSVQFSQGMVTEHRSRLLGDWGPNDPSLWRWGGTAELTPDLMLMVFAKDDMAAIALADELTKEIDGLSVMQNCVFEASLPVDRDHFNFEDGISQPKIGGSPNSSGTTNEGDIAAGEFLVGHPNQMGQIDPVPTFALSAEANGHEFGQNGTYLVYRQMDQDPELFHKFCSENDPKNPERVGSWLVGRWPDGTPLEISPDQPMAGSLDTPFGYSSDPIGAKCPLGAHIRRANPRDGLRSPDDAINAKSLTSSLERTAHHRIMRRGRMYGPTWRPASGQPCPPAQRGLHFICLNSNIQNQFELIQQTWVSSTKFLGLVDEVDPMVGVGSGPNGACSYTIQQFGEVRKKLVDMPRFIVVRGGAYFFMPSVVGIRMLAGL